MKLRSLSVLFSLSAVFALLTPLESEAKGFDRYYISGTVGSNFSNAHGGTFAIGLDDPVVPLRVEFELQYRLREKNTVFVDFAGLQQGDIHVYGPFANIFYDWHNDTRFTPYFGGGLGYVKIDQASRSDYKLAYQGMAGVAFELASHIDIFGGYRYVETRTPDLTNILSDKFRKHIGEVGLRIRF